MKVEGFREAGWNAAVDVTLLCSALFRFMRRYELWQLWMYVFGVWQNAKRCLHDLR
jgi:hypothetical protein